MDQHIRTKGLSLTTNEQSAIVWGWHPEADILVSEERDFTNMAVTFDLICARRLDSTKSNNLSLVLIPIDCN